jgi:hypothetical protein
LIGALRFRVSHVACIAFFAAGCPSAVDDGCRPVAARVDLIFPDGSASLASIVLQGPCSRASTSCQIIPACNGLRTEDCPCHVVIEVKTETAGTCGIDVASPAGGMFHADVPVTGSDFTNSSCSYGTLVDPSQSTITVEFSGGT